MKTRSLIVLVPIFILMLLSMLVLPLTVQKSSISETLMSEMGAEGLPGAWVVNLYFIVLGSVSIISGWNFYSGFGFQKVILLLFGLSLILTAFVNYAPEDAILQHNKLVNEIRTYFTATANLSFVLLAISTAVLREDSRERFLTVTAGLSAAFLSILISEVNQYAGIWQRIQFLIYSGWMLNQYK